MGHGAEKRKKSKRIIIICARRRRYSISQTTLVVHPPQYIKDPCKIEHVLLHNSFLKN